MDAKRSCQQLHPASHIAYFETAQEWSSIETVLDGSFAPGVDKVYIGAVVLSYSPDALGWDKMGFHHYVDYYVQVRPHQINVLVVGF